ncbi:hypothetical protein B0H17DRAFT_1220329 [Mycena rosella]|uniref:Uncharacterized protein n=1 Tax=Mycena rosella TaxID=1033263 RepID=A0AAD7BBC5_MYCRO|nr:hypothetical protein B0H17DRAFT_1220329 [Mycena rosella]
MVEAAALHPELCPRRPNHPHTRRDFDLDLRRTNAQVGAVLLLGHPLLALFLAFLLLLPPIAFAPRYIPPRSFVVSYLVTYSPPHRLGIVYQHPPVPSLAPFSLPIHSLTHPSQVRAVSPVARPQSARVRKTFHPQMTCPSRAEDTAKERRDVSGTGEVPPRRCVRARPSAGVAGGCGCSEREPVYHLRRAGRRRSRGAASLGAAVVGAGLERGGALELRRRLRGLLDGQRGITRVFVPLSFSFSLRSATLERALMRDPQVTSWGTLAAGGFCDRGGGGTRQSGRDDAMSGRRCVLVSVLLSVLGPFFLFPLRAPSPALSAIAIVSRVPGVRVGVSCLPGVPNRVPGCAGGAGPRAGIERHPGIAVDTDTDVAEINGWAGAGRSCPARSHLRAVGAGDTGRSPRVRVPRFPPMHRAPKKPPVRARQWPCRWAASLRWLSSRPVHASTMQAKKPPLRATVVALLGGDLGSWRGSSSGWRGGGRAGVGRGEAGRRRRAGTRSLRVSPHTSRARFPKREKRAAFKKAARARAVVAGPLGGSSRSSTRPVHATQSGQHAKKPPMHARQWPGRWASVFAAARRARPYYTQY